MSALDWSQCPAVESVPGRLGGKWVFRDTRMPISAVFLNLAAGATVDEIVEQFDISREEIEPFWNSRPTAAKPCRFRLEASRLI